MIKQKLYQAEQQASEFENQVAEKRIETQRLNDQVLKAEVEASKVRETTAKAKKLIDKL